MVVRLLKRLGQVLLLVFGLTGLYLLSALASALFPVAGREQSAEAGAARVYLCADAVHADFVLPLRDVAANWAQVFPEVAAQGRDYLSIGWGDLVFFTEIPTWGDVRPGHVFSLFTGRNPVALRVVAVDEPAGVPGCRTLEMDGPARQALGAHIMDSLAFPSGPAVRVLSSRMAFYQAAGHYSPFHTCNQWIADGLGKAALRHAWFSPFSFGVTWPLSA